MSQIHMFLTDDGKRKTQPEKKEKKNYLNYNDSEINLSLFFSLKK